MTDANLDEVAMPASAKKKSGYRRLQMRHHELVAANDALKRDYEGLQIDIDKLLVEHRNLMDKVKSRNGNSHPSWFEGANTVLGQLAENPSAELVEAFAAAIVVLQRRLGGIVMRITP